MHWIKWYIYLKKRSHQLFQYVNEMTAINFIFRNDQQIKEESYLYLKMGSLNYIYLIILIIIQVTKITIYIYILYIYCRNFLPRVIIRIISILDKN